MKHLRAYNITTMPIACPSVSYHFPHLSPRPIVDYNCSNISEILKRADVQPTIRRLLVRLVTSTAAAALASCSCCTFRRQVSKSFNYAIWRAFTALTFGEPKIRVRVWFSRICSRFITSYIAHIGIVRSVLSKVELMKETHELLVNIAPLPN